MSQQFNIGDIVKLNGTEQEGRVIGLAHNGEFLWIALASSSTHDVYVGADNVTFVRARTPGQGEQAHPGKLET
jgi:hypothetical protein